MSDSDENGNQLPRKRRRYNKLLLDSSITPLVSRQTLRRWSKHVQDAKNIMISSSSSCETMNKLIPEQSKNIDIHFFETDKDKNYENTCIKEDNKKNGNEYGNYETDNKEDINDNEVSASNDAISEVFENYFDDSSINKDENMKNDKTIMFENSQTTVSQVILMIHTYCVRFNISDEERHALFNMAKIWADPKVENINYTKYKLSKRLDPPENIYQYIFYCSKCNCLLGKFVKKDLLSNTQSICEKCQQNYKITTNAMNYFLSRDVKFQLKTLLENVTIRKMLLENITIIKNRLKKKRINTINDVYDGELYKNLYNNQQENTILLTFNFNSDGAPIFKSSKSGIWPIQIIINELPPRVRFRYIILAAMWMTRSEPSPQFMNLYMKIFIDQLRNLMENGITIKLSNNKEIIFILKPLCATVDSIARPVMQNRLQFNGHYGCSWCYHFGKYEDGAMRYPFEDEDSLLRNHNTFIQNMIEAEETNKFVMGVKGYAEITNLDNFDCIWGFPFDYMHGLLLGTVCTLWTKIWTVKGTNKFNLSKKDIKKVEERLLNIRMTREIHRTPRSFNAGKWKASEWRSWILYTSLPCLLDVLETKFLSSFALLVRSTHVLLSEDITVKDLEQCRIDLIRFTGNCEEYYGFSAMTFNTHALLHVIDHVYKSGPLCMTSTFPFENGIFVLKQKLTSPKGVLKQISKRLIQKTILESKLLNTNDDISFHQICRNLLKNSYILGRNISQTYSNTHLLAEDNNIDENIKQLIINKFDDEKDINDLKIFKNIYHNNVLYTASSNKRIKKTDDRFFENVSGKIIKIFKIVLYKNECYILGYEYTVQSLCIGNTIINQILKVVSKSSNLIWLSLNDIKRKVVHVNIKNVSYFCHMPNTIEIQ